MFINGINFPNKILEAIQSDNLVVFAGAGVSANEPTLLPDFKELTNRIAEGTGKSLGDDEPCEVFLGHLKSTGVNVNQQAADLLSSEELKHNEMHEAIIDLFNSPSKVKIVTTNYDQMFEKVLEKKSVRVPVFSAPALPLGDDVDGIIHIHGTIDNPRYMVITDDDFGKAYLTEGYTARFLERLFQTYTVLFIGYSYNDIILRYLTRAMSRNADVARFVMTEEDSYKWKDLGISSVYFPSGEYGRLKESVKKLGQRTKRSLIEWKSQFKEISERPPSDFSLDTEIDYCLASVEKARILADCIGGEEWLIALDKKGCFDNLFVSEGELSEFDRIWKDWLIKKFVGTNDAPLKRVLIKRGCNIHPELAKGMLRKIGIGADNISDNVIEEYTIILEKYIEATWEIFRIIEILSKRNLYTTCQKLFAKYFDITFILEKNFWTEENYIWKHRFKGDFYYINESWEACREAFLDKYPDRLLYLIKNTICELHDKYKLLRSKSDLDEPWQTAMIVIEDRDEQLEENPFILLSNIFWQSCKALEKTKRVFVKEFLLICLQESSELLGKIVLKALRELEEITPNEKFDIFIDNVPISSISSKEQIFLLIASIFNDITEDRKNCLIDLIESQNEFDEERHNEYQKYNWCVWIKRYCPNNIRINKMEEEILSRNDFEPREHPELDFESSTAVWIADKSPIEQSQMLQMDLNDLLEYLAEYNENSFEGYSRDGLLNVFSQCCKSDYNWTIKIAESLIEKRFDKVDVWSRMIQGIKEADIDIDKRIKLLSYLSEHIGIVGDTIGLAKFLKDTIEKDTIKNEFTTYELQLFEIANAIWENRDDHDYGFGRLIDTTINSALGNVLLSYIYMISYCDEEGIPKKYKEVFDKNLDLDGLDKEISLCVLAGYFNFLCMRDYDWCIEKFTDILEGKEQSSFAAAWEGILFFSHHLNRDIADVLAPIYLKAVKHIDWLSSEVRNGFIDLYLLLLIHAIEEPCIRYIPEFYDVATEEDRNEFVSRIEYRLRSMESDLKLQWWNQWLKQYLNNRFQNKPKGLIASEYKIIMNWLPELREVFDEAVDIICDNEMPSKVDRMFLYRVKKNNIVEDHPHSLIKLLTSMLNGGTIFEYCEDKLQLIYKAATGLNEQEIKDFKEAALKRNITIE